MKLSSALILLDDTKAYLEKYKALGMSSPETLEVASVNAEIASVKFYEAAYAMQMDAVWNHPASEFEKEFAFCFLCIVTLRECSGIFFEVGKGEIVVNGIEIRLKILIEVLEKITKALTDSN